MTTYLAGFPVKLFFLMIYTDYVYFDKKKKSH